MTVQDYVMDSIGHKSGVLIFDETGFVKRGSHSVGVARPYSGTAGRLENAQVGVFLCYARRFDHALIDRRLYLPEEWTQHQARCGKAKVPQNIGFATRPQIAKALIAKALDSGVPCTFVLADAVYGSDSQ